MPPRDARAFAEDIARACAERLAYYKAPGYVAFVDAMPVTPTQKIQRGAIKALAARGGRRPRHDRSARLQGALAARREGARMSRASYEGVVIAAPVTVPYVRYSTRDAHWFLGRALAALVKACGHQEGAARRAVRVELHARRPTPRSA